MTQVEKLVFFDDDCPTDDAIDNLLAKLDHHGKNIMTTPGCRIMRNPETGKVAALFPSVPFYPSDSPEQRKLESDWGARALAMHSRQKSLSPLEDKPSEIIPKYHEIETCRGD